jgi:lipoyl(octanoyl) transferase
MKVSITDWGLIPYAEACERQKSFFETTLRKKENHQPTTSHLFLCEHPHVITIGQHGRLSNLLLPEKELKAKQVELYHVNRGGDITYHGPGQLVGYPILDLEEFHLGLKAYISRIEETIIRTIAAYGLKGERLPGAPGVWLGSSRSGNARKVAAIGVRSSRYVTMHGFALNVNTDLSYFKLINPCGFTDKGVTSLQKELEQTVELNEVKRLLIYQFERLLSAE